MIGGIRYWSKKYRFAQSVSLCYETKRIRFTEPKSYEELMFEYRQASLECVILDGGPIPQTVFHRQQIGFLQKLAKSRREAIVLRYWRTSNSPRAGRIVIVPLCAADYNRAVVTNSADIRRRRNLYDAAVARLNAKKVTEVEDHARTRYEKPGVPEDPVRPSVDIDLAARIDALDLPETALSVLEGLPLRTVVDDGEFICLGYQTIKNSKDNVDRTVNDALSHAVRDVLAKIPTVTTKSNFFWAYFHLGGMLMFTLGNCRRNDYVSFVQKRFKILSIDTESRVSEMHAQRWKDILRICTVRDIRSLAVLAFDRHNNVILDEMHHLALEDGSSVKFSGDESTVRTERTRPYWTSSRRIPDVASRSRTVNTTSHPRGHQWKSFGG